MSLEEHDTLTRRCPMLGHELNFAYCRAPGEQAIPCRKIFDCWFERFDIQVFMQAHYPPETIAQILQPKQPKMASLLEIIQRVQNMNNPEKPS